MTSVAGFGPSRSQACSSGSRRLGSRVVAPVGGGRRGTPSKVHFAAALLVGLAILLPGAGRAQPPSAYRIIAFGDFGVGGDFQRSFGQAVRAFETRNRSNMLLALGDNDYTESPTAFRANWAASFGWGRRRGLAVAGVIGNHDARVQGGRYEFSALGMRGRYYKRSAGPAELFLLDSNRIDSAQTAWLARSLARSNARWKIAVFHHPAYTCGTYRAHREIVRRWVPLFERHGVVLALSGHDHNYQRLGPKRRGSIRRPRRRELASLPDRLLPRGVPAPGTRACRARIRVPRDPSRSTRRLGRRTERPSARSLRRGWLG